MTVNLTKATVRDLPRPAHGRVTYFDAAMPRFGLRLTAAGGRTWVVVYRHAGRVRWYKIGSADNLNLDDARKLARLVFVEVDAGRDPGAERKAETGITRVAADADEEHASKAVNAPCGATVSDRTGRARFASRDRQRAQRA